MARPQDTSPRPTTTQNFYFQGQPNDQPDPSDRRQHDVKMEPDQNPKPNSETNGDKKLLGPMFDKPIPIATTAGGKAHYASPLAATLLARFDPSERRIQPAEDWVFHDRAFAKRGRI